MLGLLDLEAFEPPSSPLIETPSKESSGADGGDVGSERDEPQEPPPKKNKVSRPETSKPARKRPGQADRPAESQEDGKKRKTKKTSQEKLRDLEDKLRDEKGFSHNFDFQRLHREKDMQPRRGHWQEFLAAYRDGKVMRCAACKECRQVIDSGSQGRQEESDAEGQEADPIADDAPKIEGRKRGRPRKNSEWVGLKEWMKQNRSGIYSLLDEKDNKWLCRLCNKELKLQRDGITFVQAHEQRALHQAKLALFRNGFEDLSNLSQDAVLST